MEPSLPPAAERDEVLAGEPREPEELLDAAVEPLLVDPAEVSPEEPAMPLPGPAVRVEKVERAEAGVSTRSRLVGLQGQGCLVLRLEISKTKEGCIDWLARVGNSQRHGKASQTNFWGHQSHFNGRLIP